MNAPLMTPKEVASELRVTERHILRLVRDGALPSVRVGRFHRFEPDDIAAYRNGNRSAPPAPKVTTLGESLGQITRRRPA